jgi:hypothetical protein
MCWKCEDAIGGYMRLYNCSFPEAIEGLEQERRRLVAFALATISERHTVFPFRLARRLRLER